MTRATIKPETKEETVLREYRHVRTILREERGKVAYLEERIDQLRQKIKDKQAVIKVNQLEFDKLRKEASRIVSEMLDEDVG